LRTSPAAPASKALAGTPSAQPTPKPAAAQPVVAANQPKPKVKMVIPEIPPFQRAGKAKPSPIPIEPTADLSVPVVKAEDAVVAPAPGAVKEEAASSVASPAAGVAKLNPGASTFVFKPNPKASNFTPVSSRLIVGALRLVLTTTRYRVERVPITRRLQS
jgi:hypothetical protein